ncbi:type IV secretion system protein VirB10 [Phenylobacterium sp. LjRoot225]|uniref:type IV secretion system protein VirB10 n=1 Tax=Phenylobacterium sp. LjRoot225 TaxID=3342285 RepID=UPI003ECCAF32
MTPPSADPETLELQPRLSVARTSGGLPTPLIIAAFIVLAVALFLVLNGRRSQAEARSLTAPAPDAAPSEPAAPLQLPAAPSETPPAAPVQPALPQPSPAPAPASPPPAVASDVRTRLSAPAVVVDLSGQNRPLTLAQAAAPPRPAATGETSASAAMAQALEGQPGPGAVESMAQRLQLGGSTPGAAIATQMGDLGLVIPQGAVIPAVLETAINSDLPGYTRAIVSRDVRSFDGRTVLIPRGSRLIGQYRSAVSLGQSRAFVIWSRVTRPDGVTVQIGSPGTDQLGRGGLTGDVDRHFFTRFGGSILLSVLNAGVASIAKGPTTTVAIGSPGQAAAAASLVQPESVPPTIKVPQGEAIRIFVARDLDFSAVAPVNAGPINAGTGW